MLTTALKFSKCFQIQSFRNCRSAAIQSEKTAAKTDEAVKTTLVQKWMKYWKTVLNDYRDVATDVGKDIKEKPIKSAIIFSLVGVFTYIVRHNPDEKSFRDAFIK